jgi:hypothetical protein
VFLIVTLRPLPDEIVTFESLDYTLKSNPEFQASKRDKAVANRFFEKAMAP